MKERFETPRLVLVRISSSDILTISDGSSSSSNDNSNGDNTSSW